MVDITMMIQHFVAFIQNKVFDTFEINLFGGNQCTHSSGSADYYLWFVYRQHLFVESLGNPTEKTATLTFIYLENLSYSLDI